MTTWHEVYLAKTAHPEWSAQMIADHLGCRPSYVRSTAQRQGWILPAGGSIGGRVIVKVPATTIKPLCRAEETLHDCLKRIVHVALVRETTKLERSRAALTPEKG